MNTFFRRTLTGAGIVLFIAGGFWLHPVSFILTGLVLLTGTQYEYLLMVKNSGTKINIMQGLAAGVLTYALSVLVAAGYLPWKSFLFLAPVITVIMVAELYRRNEKPFDVLAHTFFSVLYVVVPVSLFPFAAFGHTGLESLLPHQGIVFSPGIILGFFFLIWANDTGAYLTGMTIGKHKLWERISPKKTWEGFFGGLVIAALIAWLLSGWLGVISTRGWIISALIISVAGTYGDLVESMLKRANGVKDSGNILPGHGGFLDRFDSAVVAFPLVYLFISLLG